MTVTRNLVTDPGVLATDDRAPSSRGGGEEKYAGRKTPDFATPRQAHASDGCSMVEVAAEEAANALPIGVPLASGRGVMRQQVRTVK